MNSTHLCDIQHHRCVSTAQRLATLCFLGIIHVAHAAEIAPADTIPPTVSRKLPGDSVYQLSVPLVDQAAREFSLDRFRGKPLLVTMFYSHCPFVCPRIAESLKKTEAALPIAVRNKVPVLMVSFDIARDDPTALKALAVERHIDTNVWTLARSDAAHTRKLAAILGIQYRELGGGDFNHTSVLLLLDRDGRIVGKTFEIGGIDPAFVKLVAKTTARD
jgi:protein SCO1/2